MLFLNDILIREYCYSYQVRVDRIKCQVGAVSQMLGYCGKHIKHTCTNSHKSPLVKYRQNQKYTAVFCVFLVLNGSIFLVFLRLCNLSEVKLQCLTYTSNADILEAGNFILFTSS